LYFYIIYIKITLGDEKGMELQTLIQYGIIAIILVIISLIILKLSKKDFGLEINKLVKYLGGKDNILDTEVNMSRFKVTLKDITKVDKEGIQKLGAKGIVEIDNQLKIIFGNDSRTLKRYVDEIKK
jgi:glucose-like phosphotransferase system IIB component